MRNSATWQIERKYLGLPQTQAAVARAVEALLSGPNSEQKDAPTAENQAGREMGVTSYLRGVPHGY